MSRCPFRFEVNAMRERLQVDGKHSGEIEADNDAMKALQRGFAYTASKTPGMEVLQQYGTVYRMRRSQEVLSVRRGERKRPGWRGAARGSRSTALPRVSGAPPCALGDRGGS